LRDISLEFTVGLVAPLPPPNGSMAIQGQKLMNRLTAEGIDVKLFPTNLDFPAVLMFAKEIKGFRTLLRFWIYLWNLRQLKSVDVVHILGASHLFFFISVVPALVLGRVFKKKVILNYRGGEAEQFFSRYGAFVLPFMKLADHIAVPSAFLAKIFMNEFNLNTEILPNIADFELFHFHRRVDFRPDLIVARSLEPIYGHKTILKAFAIIIKKYPQATLKIAGDGSLRRELETFSQDLGLEKSVEFLGTLSPEQLSVVYRHTDIMVNASTIDNFPGALLESFICGLPVVSSAVGGIPLMVTTYVSGLLFEAGDVQALASNIEYILKNPQAAQRFIAEANLFAQQYRWPEVREKLFTLYDLKSVD